MLELKNISVGYNSIPVIEGVNLQCMPGEIITIAGLNGSGKSCLLRSLIGEIPFIAGDLHYSSQNITGLSLKRRLGLGMALCPEGRMIFPNLTVHENLLSGLAIKGVFFNTRKEAVEKMFGLFPKLKQRKYQLGGTLSGGEQQFLAIARALIAEPKVLLLDEPSLGISPLVINDIATIIRDVADSGVAIIVSDQKKDVLFRLANKKYIIFNKALGSFK